MLPPAATGTGLAKFVTARSAESPTWTLAVALLFPGFGSTVVELPVSVCEMVVPDATFVFTCSTRVKVAVAFTAMFAESVQMRVARLQLQVPPGPVIDTAVVPAGSESLNVGVAAAARPPLVRTCV
jgi:hypothetical protein